MQNTNDNNLKIAAFDGIDRAETAVHHLLEAGVPNERISIACSEASPLIQENVEQLDPVAERTVPTALAGGTIGSVLGGLVAAIGVAATGAAGLLVAGPILGGAVAMGITGGFVGAMAARGIDPDIADYYDQALNRGEVLVSVETPESSPAMDGLRRKIEDLLVGAGGRTHELPGVAPRPDAPSTVG